MMSETENFNLYAKVSLDEIKAEIDGYKEANDPDYEETINDLELVFAQRLEHVAGRFKTKRYFAGMLRDEIRTMRARLAAVEADGERDKRYLERNITPGEDVNTATAEIRWRKSVAVEVENPIVLPTHYQVVKISADKRAIKLSIDQGEKVPGAKLVSHVSMQVR